MPMNNNYAYTKLSLHNFEFMPQINAIFFLATISINIEYMFMNAYCDSHDMFICVYSGLIGLSPETLSSYWFLTSTLTRNPSLYASTTTSLVFVTEECWLQPL